MDKKIIYLEQRPNRVRPVSKAEYDELPENDRLIADTDTPEFKEDFGEE